MAAKPENDGGNWRFFEGDPKNGEEKVAEEAYPGSFEGTNPGSHGGGRDMILFMFNKIEKWAPFRVNCLVPKDDRPRLIPNIHDEYLAVITQKKFTKQQLGDYLKNRGKICCEVRSTSRKRYYVVIRISYFVPISRNFFFKNCFDEFFIIL